MGEFHRLLYGSLVDSFFSFLWTHESFLEVSLVSLFRYVSNILLFILFFVNLLFFIIIIVTFLTIILLILFYSFILFSLNRSDFRCFFPEKQMRIRSISNFIFYLVILLFVVIFSHFLFYLSYLFICVNFLDVSRTPFWFRFLIFSI